MEDGRVVEDSNTCTCDVEEETGCGEIEEGEDEEDDGEDEGRYCCDVEVFGHRAGTGEASWHGEFGHCVRLYTVLEIYDTREALG